MLNQEVLLKLQQIIKLPIITIVLVLKQMHFFFAEVYTEFSEFLISLHFKPMRLIFMNYSV